MAHVHALVVAAGSGTRSGGETPKQFRPVGGRAVIVHAVAALAGHARVDGLTIVIGRGQEAMLDVAFAGSPPPHVTGGATRAASVRNGLAVLDLPDSAIVLIHDAARPFLPAPVVDRLLDALESAEGAVPVLPVADTLAQADATLGDVTPRDGLVRVQTPQAFRLGAIRRAHAAWTGDEPTDDAQAARAAGIKIATVQGDAMLDKLTYPEDFARAEARMAPAQVRTGMGFDVHAFCPGDHLWMGGLRLPHSHGLAGHSDADVVLHAIVDALLGCIAAGDIGMHFPPSDPQWKGAASSRFVEHARGLVEEAGRRIEHVDVTVICEAPKVGPHREAIRDNVSALLGLPRDRVSIKATTTECLGFTGRREGIAAQAVATVSLPA